MHYKMLLQLEADLFNISVHLLVTVDLDGKGQRAGLEY